MAARGRPASTLAVQYSSKVWGPVGRLSREVFAAIQAAVEAQAKRLGEAAELPETGDLSVQGCEVHYTLDAHHRLLTVTAVRPAR